MPLYNRINGKELKERLKEDNEQRITVSFYKYHHILDPKLFRDELYILLDSLHVMGRIYVAFEGINAQVSLPQVNFEVFKNQLYSLSFLKGVRLNTAVEDNGKSFFKLKILVRPKIVADGLNDHTFDVTNRGTHVGAQEFNRIAEQEGTIIVDMRNHYESEVGHFKNAICPDVDTFRDELKVVEAMLENQKEKNLLMYCTGGIRCEKASAWFKHQGFKNVFQLDGGIIEYAKQVKQEGLENKFIGKNFVFDERLGERISEDIISTCHQCGTPCDQHTNCKNEGCHLLFIQCDHCAATLAGCCSLECKEILTLSAEAQKKLRQGINKGRQVFKKGRAKDLKLLIENQEIRS